MPRSMLEVAAACLPGLRQAAQQCGFEVLAKEGYDPTTQVYRVGISGSAVPDANQVRAEFTEHRDGDQISLSVEFHPVFQVKREGEEE